MFVFSLSLSWTMPEEFRAWQAMVQAAEDKKRADQAAAATAAVAAAAAAAEAEAQRTASSSLSRHQSQSQLSSAAAAAPVVYSSAAEAADAFADMLMELRVSSVAKMKEVQDLCGADPRWEALRTQGERKQALAEYQV